MVERDNLEIRVANFGPIAKAEIDLRPLTVFAGPSNTGKSYMAILVYALHNPLGWLSLLDWQMPEGKDWDNFVAWMDEELSASSAKEWSDDSYTTLPDSVSSLIRSQFMDAGHLNPISSAFEDELKRCFSVRNIERLKRYKSNDDTSIVLGRRNIKLPDNTELFELQFKLNHSNFECAASTPAEISLQLSDLSSINYLRQLSSKAITWDCFIDSVSDFLNPLRDHTAYYLPADRAGVMHAHRAIVGSLIKGASRAVLQPGVAVPMLSGVMSDFLEQILVLDNPADSDTDRELSDGIERKILGGEVVVGESIIGYPEFSYRPAGWEENVPLIRSSSMVSELAPVVLYLRYVVDPDELLIIEEPESHLHPEMQVEFTRQLAAAVRSGVRVMLTTHSEWVLEELANMVHLSSIPESDRREFTGADFALSPDDVGVWLFDYTDDSEGVVVREIPLDVELGSFPVGFGNVTEYLYNRWAEIANEVEWLKSR